MIRPPAILFVAILAAGCSPDAYKQSADFQVDSILKDRQKSTLDYQPQASLDKDVAITPSRQAFDKIPVTRMPPPTTAPMERAYGEVPYGPLGPDLRTLTSPDFTGDTLSSRQLMDNKPDWVYGPPAPGDEPLKLDLFASLAYAVENSRSYKDQIDELYLRTLNVTLQRHLFEATPFAKVGYRYDGGQRDVNYRSALTATASGGVRQQLPYGGEVVAQGLVAFVDGINTHVNNGESASASISATIPLLRGAGMVNLEPLISAERKIVYQIRAFESFRRDFVVNTASAYFRILALQQSVNNRRQNLANLSLLTDRTIALYANAPVGRALSFLEVQRSRQAELTAQNDLINAEATYNAAIDDFKVQLGMSVESRLDVIPVQLAISVPHADPNAAVEQARTYRLELQTARDLIEDAQRNVKNSANGLLPDLTFDANATAGNVPGRPASNLNGNTATYGAGLTLDLPLDRVKERNAYRTSLIDLQQAQRGFTQQSEQIASDVRDSLRLINNAELSVKIQLKGIELARRRLENAGILFQQGKISNRDMVDAQQSLLDAQDRYEQAHSALQTRVLQYLRDTGTLRVDPAAGALGVAMDRGKPRK